MIGKTLGNYQIREPLGAGGMGEVYRAHDANLKRDVAIKVLPEALAADPERLARLQREAHLLASVNHPNIAAIYNLEASDDTRWLVLELIEGTTVEQLLRAGPLPIEEALRIGSQVANALEAAHEKGIVHRDLKSANVMVDGKGRVKVLDFGIAKDLSGARVESPDSTDTSLATQAAIDMATHLTGTGVIVGTAPYMSPEQIRGHDVDKRTDNWAFGCLLFELLTGRRPFDRETVADTLAAILEHEPNWDLLPARTPAAVRSLLQRCLHKDADNRLHDIADARIELEHIAMGATSPASGRDTGTPARTSARAVMTAAALVVLASVIAVGWGLSNLFGPEGATVEPSAAGGAASLGTSGAVTLRANAVAVAPFEHLGEPDTEYLTIGLTDEIRNRLGAVGGLTVPGWPSAATLTRDETPLDIGRSLGAATLVTGTVRMIGSQQRVVVNLIDNDSGNALWSESYNQSWADMEAIFGLQDDVARRVIEALALELSDDEAAGFALRRTADPAAYDAYLKGLNAFPRRTGEDLVEALEHFNRAVELDENFALAHVGVATTTLLLRKYRDLDDAQAFATARASAERALELDKSLGRAVAVLAGVAKEEGDPTWPAQFERALALSPNDDLAHLFYGSNLMFNSRMLRVPGTPERAWEVTERARDLNPFNPPAHENLGWLLFMQGRLEEARESMATAVDLDPEYHLGHMALGAALSFSGRAREAIPHIRTAVRLNPFDSARVQTHLGIAYAHLGQADDAAIVFKGRASFDPSADGPYRDAGDTYREVVGSPTEAETWYGLAIELRRRTRNLFPLLLAWLDQARFDDVEDRLARAEAPATGAEGPVAPDFWLGLARLNLELSRGDYPAGAELARQLTGGRPVTSPDVIGLTNSALYDNQLPQEPLGYFGVLTGDPASSLHYLEVNFPDLLQENPRLHPFNLKAAIDLAAVFRSMGQDARAELLLTKSEALLDSIPEGQRRYQFRAVPMHVYALQGRTEEALDAMQQAIDDGFFSGWWRLEHKPHFASIRDEPRFRQMVRQLRERATG